MSGENEKSAGYCRCALRRLNLEITHLFIGHSKYPDSSMGTTGQFKSHAEWQKEARQNCWETLQPGQSKRAKNAHWNMGVAEQPVAKEYTGDVNH